VWGGGGWVGWGGGGGLGVEGLCFFFFVVLFLFFLVWRVFFLVGLLLGGVVCLCILGLWWGVWLVVCLGCWGGVLCWCGGGGGWWGLDVGWVVWGVLVWGRGWGGAAHFPLLARPAPALPLRPCRGLVVRCAAGRMLGNLPRALLRRDRQCQNEHASSFQQSDWWSDGRLRSTSPLMRIGTRWAVEGGQIIAFPVRVGVPTASCP